MNDYFSEDVFLPMSFDVNVCGSFVALGFKTVHFGGHAFGFESSSRFFFGIFCFVQGDHNQYQK
jgi:hypothetical protein